MAGRLTEKLKTGLFNIPGLRINDKVIVIESDDWGSIRMPSKEIYDYWIKKGYPLDECPYNKNDCLESNSDLERLFEVLSSVKDRDGNPAVITANTIIGNPDFSKIKESNFSEYHYELFTETLKHYPEHDGVFALYREGIKNKLFMPQFHGREHVNVFTWMKALQNDTGIIRELFEQQMFTLHEKNPATCHSEYLDAYGSHDNTRTEVLKKNIEEGLKQFENLFGFKSVTSISPCYIWPSETEETLKLNGVEIIQSGRVQKIPLVNNPGNYRKKRIYTGMKNKLGQRYTVRNCTFEPSSDLNKDWVDSCLREIKNSFLWSKPAIISAHRVNFAGSINESNRKENLQKLTVLLKNTINKWPDIRFLSSDQLIPLLFNKEMI